MSEPFEPFPEVMYLGHTRLQGLCDEWCSTPQAQECGVGAVTISPDCRSFSPALQANGAWGDGKGTSLHFPFDRLLHYIVDHGCPEEQRATIKDRLRILRQRVGPNLFQNYRVNNEAVLMSVRCPVCQKFLVSTLRLLVIQARTYPWTGDEEVTCPGCGVDVAIRPDNVLWAIDPEQAKEA
ncbi:hypothetical protein [Paludisphaera soli]|uniref:hypothetical protein n=1 Tax=Paludisphaera soli TaxID=2712865 RepID=UPI0013EB074A|nr:hypothetical protein [Paludisphaera soli]